MKRVEPDLTPDWSAFEGWEHWIAEVLMNRACRLGWGCEFG